MFKNRLKNCLNCELTNFNARLDQKMPLHETKSRARSLGGSKPSWQSQNQFLENMYLRKREVEHRKSALWDSTARYFDRLQKQNKIFEAWSTPGKISVILLLKNYLHGCFKTAISHSGFLNELTRKRCSKTPV